MRPRFTLTTVAIVGTVALAGPIVGTLAFASSPRVAIAGTMPRWVAAAKQIGTPAASKALSVNVILPLRDAAGAERQALSVSDSTNKSYGHYLTPSQFNARYAPTAAQVSQLRTYLSRQGLTVTGTAQGNRWITARGTVAKLSSAFGIALKTYSYDGQTSLAPTSNVTVPSSIAPLIAGVTGLDTISTTNAPNHIKPTPQAGKHVPKPKAPTGALPNSVPPPQQPCSTFWGQHTQTVPTVYGQNSLPTTPCGYGPQALRKAYGVDTGIGGATGRGVTVAITDAYALPTMLSDLNRWSTEHGVPTMQSGQYTEAGTASTATFDNQASCGGEVGWNEEEALDVEAVHGMAPGATIHYVGGKDCGTGLDTAVNYIVQNHAADIVSNSWGRVETSASATNLEHSFFVQGALEGIGFYFSTGDDGDNTFNPDKPSAPFPISVDYPSTDPNVTAVGGTSLGATETGSILFQTSWGDKVDAVNFDTTPATLSKALPGDFIFGGGGGTSTVFAQPQYQKGRVPSRFATASPKRVTPDVALDADPETGYQIALTESGTYTSFVIGGTSLSCPLFAGFQALASQGRRHALGFANPLLYVVRSAFIDVVNPLTPRAFSSTDGKSVVVLGQDSSLVAIAGFDNTTGLGTPAGSRLVLAEQRPALAVAPLPPRFAGAAGS